VSPVILVLTTMCHAACVAPTITPFPNLIACERARDALTHEWLLAEDNTHIATCLQTGRPSGAAISVSPSRPW
jgi:hypothetical protein